MIVEMPLGALRAALVIQQPEITMAMQHTDAIPQLVLLR